MSYDPGISGIAGASDVFLNNPAANDALSYSTTTGKWENLPVDKARVGLANVDNTADIDKPISTATQAAIATKQPQGGVVATVSDIPAGAAVGSLWVVTS